MTSVVREKPLLAAGVGLVAATVCAAALIAKKYSLQKPILTTVPPASNSATGAEENDAYASDAEEIPSTDDTSQIDAEYTAIITRHTVHEQERNSCGFHSIYNALQLHRMVQNKNNTIDVCDNQTFVATWQKRLGKLEDLTHEDVKQIIKGLAERIPMLVIPDVEQMMDNLDALTDSFDDSLFSTLKQMRSSDIGTPFCFIIGDIKNTEEDGKLKDGYGHWVAAVVHKVAKNKIHIEYANSLPSHDMNASIEKLKEMLCMPVARIELKRILAPTIYGIISKTKRSNQATTYEECLVNDLYDTLTLVDKQKEKYLLEELKPLKEFFSIIKSKIIPATRSEFVKMVWDLINKQTPAVQSLLEQ